jgi:hypothetical protein
MDQYYFALPASAPLNFFDDYESQQIDYSHEDILFDISTRLDSNENSRVTSQSDSKAQSVVLSDFEPGVSLFHRSSSLSLKCIQEQEQGLELYSSPCFSTLTAFRDTQINFQLFDKLESPKQLEEISEE